MLISYFGEMNHVTPILIPYEPHPLGFQTPREELLRHQKTYQKIFGCLGSSMFHVSWPFMIEVDFHVFSSNGLSQKLANIWTSKMEHSVESPCFLRVFILSNVKHTDCIHHFENRTSHVFFALKTMLFLQHEDYLL